MISRRAMLAGSALKASNGVGQTQAEKLIFNPAGYHNNVIRPLTVDVT